MATQQTQERSHGQRGHTKARAPLINLNQSGWLYVANLMALYGVSHSTIYKRITQGAYPKPDGRDGGRPYWKTDTIKKHLEG